MRTPAWLTSGLVLLLTVAASAPAFSQGVGINGTGASADASAMLDVASTTKGFLPPRMTAMQRAAIFSPATGLLVYQTDGTVGLYYNAGTPLVPSWQVAGAGAAGQWSVNGTSLFYNAGSVGIGRNPPLTRLDVLGGNYDLAGTEGDVRIGDALTRLKFGIATGGGGTGAATIMEQGPVGAYNILALGSQGNKVVYVNGNTQRFGIGTDAPTAPLGFPPTLGKKIAFFSGGSGDYGIGMATGRLQISAEAAGTDVAIGSDAGGVFTERLAVKNNGALAVSGNTGAAGQLLQSGGAGAPPSWVSPTAGAYGNFYYGVCQSPATYTPLMQAVIPGLSRQISVPANGVAMVTYTIHVSVPSCFVCGATVNTLLLWISLDGALSIEFDEQVPNGTSKTACATAALPVPSGLHTIEVVAENWIGPNMVIGSTLPSYLTVQVMNP